MIKKNPHGEIYSATNKICLPKKLRVKRTLFRSGERR